jgi:hypothetical protein
MTFEGPGLVTPDELRQVNADTSSLSVLIPPGQGGDFYYSPDGSKIALVRSDQISVVNADGSNRIDLLTFPMIMTYSEYLLYPDVVWTPDSSAIRAAIPPSDPLAEPPDLTTVWHIPADGSPPSTLMTMATIPFFQDRAEISPNAGRVAYQVPVVGQIPNLAELHISDVDGSGDIAYETGALVFEAWATDGGYFVFSQADNSSASVGQEGAAPSPFVGAHPVTDVRWIDASRFLHLKRDTGNWQLWLQPASGPSTLIANTAGDRISYDFIQ